MARGWESKSIESQMDAAEAAKPARLDVRTPEDIALTSKRSSLELTRTRVQHDYDNAYNERYRRQLEQALAFIDKQLADLG